MPLLLSCGKNEGASERVMVNQPNQSASLVGRWRQLLSEAKGDADEGVTMVFTPDGKLVYSIHKGDRTQIMNLVYEVSGDTIITDQPSDQQKEFTRYHFESNDTLVLDYGGEQTTFRREK